MSGWPPPLRRGSLKLNRGDIMRTFGKWLGRVLLALLVAAVVIGLWKREEIERLLAVNSLFSEEKIVPSCIAGLVLNSFKHDFSCVQ